MTLYDAIRLVGIEPRHLRPGTQRLPCPQCAQAKSRPRDDALALLIEDDHAVWICHRCGLRGSTRERSTAAPVRANVRPFEDAERQERAAARARAIWASAAEAAPHHPYLQAKRLPPEGMRMIERFAYSNTGVLQHVLLVPLRDEAGAICNLQGISGDGTKRFLLGGKTRGAFACVGEWRREVVPEFLAIGEGWASVMSYVRMHRAYRGIAAMSASNLPTVARLFRAKFPDAEIAIVCDQDKAGALAAGEACVAVNGVLHAPGFRFSGVIDWNDLECKTRETA
jgi:putative DNA primase/helicase